MSAPGEAISLGFFLHRHTAPLSAYASYFVFVFFFPGLMKFASLGRNENNFKNEKFQLVAKNIPNHQQGRQFPQTLATKMTSWAWCTAGDVYS